MEHYVPMRTLSAQSPIAVAPAATTTSHDSCQLMNRKKRRGMIEKRRRDRINNSLNELRRLVPAAYEKQGSAKLEKAEILQMTVDHLRMLHAKGFDTFSFDPHNFAMNYHAHGFRECLNEVDTYLARIEGMDIQDPLRLRLMSHLQCYAAQRELALKSAASAATWNPSLFTTPPPFMSAMAASAAAAATVSGNSSASAAASAAAQSASATATSSSVTNSTTDSSIYSSYGATASIATLDSHHNYQTRSHHHSHHPHHAHHLNSHASAHHTHGLNHSQFAHEMHIKSSGSPGPYNTSSGSSSASGASSTPTLTALNPYFPSSGGYPNQGQQSNGQQNGGQGSVKHYRPWGAELAY